MHKMFLFCFGVGRSIIKNDKYLLSLINNRKRGKNGEVF